MQRQARGGRALHALLTVGGFGIFCLVALPLLLPFVLGYLVAAGVEPGIAALSRRSPMPRQVSSFLCVTGAFAAVGTVLFFFLRILYAELRLLVLQLPELLQRIQVPTQRLQFSLSRLAARAPEGLRQTLQGWIDELFTDGSVLAEALGRRLTALVSGVVTHLPGLLISLVTTVIAAYMISASLPRVKAALVRRLPESWGRWLRTVRAHLKRALSGWLKAQLRLTGVVFLLLVVGLWLLGEDFALLFGGIIALLDALPVLGTGTVLVPWALLCFLQGLSRKGFGLLGLYAVTVLARTVLEPHLVGRQLGLPPLLTLMAFYVGYRIFGVPGMILLPIAAILARQLLSSGAADSRIEN